MDVVRPSDRCGGKHLAPMGGGDLPANSRVRICTHRCMKQINTYTRVPPKRTDGVDSDALLHETATNWWPAPRKWLFFLCWLCERGMHVIRYLVDKL